jgi:hypothetical protein
MYLQADMQLRERALAETAVIDVLHVATVPAIVFWLFCVRYLEVAPNCMPLRFCCQNNPRFSING